MTKPVSLIAIEGVPDIKPGDDLAAIISGCIDAMGIGLHSGDVLVLAHKIFSKAEGNIINLRTVDPSPEAAELAKKLNKDPAKVEVVLKESRSVLRAFKHETQNEGTMICEHKRGYISANAGVDASNADGTDTLITLPNDPDASLRRFCHHVFVRYGVEIGAVMTDTFGRPWRLGQVNVAIGLFAVPATRREQGTDDAWGRPLLVTEPAFADEIAAASGLVVRKAAKTPAVLFRGLEWHPNAESSGLDLLRNEKEDMFR
ncbi:MAG: coenzyme F420-0:L-glutamate ligase [Pseudomonadota bacterium]